MARPSPARRPPARRASPCSPPSTLRPRMSMRPPCRQPAPRPCPVHGAGAAPGRGRRACRRGHLVGELRRRQGRGHRPRAVHVHLAAVCHRSADAAGDPPLAERVAALARRVRAPAVPDGRARVRGVPAPVVARADPDHRRRLGAADRGLARVHCAARRCGGHGPADPAQARRCPDRLHGRRRRHRGRTGALPGGVTRRRPPDAGRGRAVGRVHHRRSTDPADGRPAAGDDLDRRGRRDRAPAVRRLGGIERRDRHVHAGGHRRDPLRGGAGRRHLQRVRVQRDPARRPDARHHDAVPRPGRRGHPRARCS